MEGFSSSCFFMQKGVAFVLRCARQASHITRPTAQLRRFCSGAATLEMRELLLWPTPSRWSLRCGFLLARATSMCGQMNRVAPLTPSLSVQVSESFNLVTRKMDMLMFKHRFRCHSIGADAVHSCLTSFMRVHPRSTHCGVCACAIRQSSCIAGT